jgi:hypothetical protein
MMPDRIGIMGSTQGVNDSSTPRPKNVASTAGSLPSRIRNASRSCSARSCSTSGAAPVLDGSGLEAKPPMACSSMAGSSGPRGSSGIAPADAAGKGMPSAVVAGGSVSETVRAMGL